MDILMPKMNYNYIILCEVCCKKRIIRLTNELKVYKMGTLMFYNDFRNVSKEIRD